MSPPVAHVFGVHLGAFTVVTGRNGTGKTALLEEVQRAAGRLAGGGPPTPTCAFFLNDGAGGTARFTEIRAALSQLSCSLLGIEELERGLDPWTVCEALAELRSAASRGVQIVVTTYSPWVLDQVPLNCIVQARRVEGSIRYERFCERPEVQAYASPVPPGTRYVNEAG